MIVGAFPFLELLISVCNETKNKLKADAAERTTRNFPCGRLTDEPSKALTKHQSQTLFNIQTVKAASIEVKTCFKNVAFIRVFCVEPMKSIRLARVFTLG